jgi:hypothetical protein
MQLSKWTQGLRTTARRVGVGRALLQLQDVRSTGVKNLVQTAWVRRHLIPKIGDAPPLPTGEVEPGLHMLLHKGRFLEGAWALYAFRYYAREPIQVTVHSDGSLDAECVSFLSRLLPGIQIIPRDRADEIVNGELERRDLVSSLEFRRRFVLGLKLFDPYVLGRAENYIVLDSDILTFSSPVELMTRNFGSHNGQAPHLYGADNNDLRYTHDRDTLIRVLGSSIPYRLNSGLLKIQRIAISLPRVEETLRKLDLLSASRISHYAEQTLYACELSHHGALALDVERYTVCGEPHNGVIVTGHYCGGNFCRTRFYLEAIPRLAREIGLSRPARRTNQ